MRSAVAALTLAGVAMAGEGYYTKSADPYPPTYDPEYPSSYDPSYPSTYDPSYPSTYDPSYPSTYDPSYPSTYDPSYPYPTSTKKDDAYDPYSTCTDDIYTSTKKNADYYPTDYPVYKYTSTKKNDDVYPTTTCTDDDYVSYSTSTVYQTKYYVVTKDKDVHTKTDTYPVTTTVYPVYKTKVPEKEYPEKEGSKPSYPASKYPEKETKKYEAEAACPTYSVKTIHTSVTTVVPTVIYETVAVPCSTYKPTPYANATKPTTKYPVVTAGASSFAASGLVAAVVGLAAVAFL